MTSFKNKTVLITGAGKGLGRAVALAFARAGADVCAVSRTKADLDSLQAEAETGIHVEAGDAAEEAFVAAVVRDCVARRGGVDVLVNNAGILTPRGPLTDVAAPDWDETMRVNLRGPFLFLKYALPGMIRRRSGSVINVTSSAGKRPAPSWGPYAVSKAGIEGLTRSAAEEVKSANVRVNALNPGGTRTRMRAAAYPEEDPLTLPTPAEVAEFFLWMAGPDCRLSGASLDYRVWKENGETIL
jgi:NAD(P)-dependent dehydrogenase (short-subunit alcohol dehydrogenase family)